VMGKEFSSSASEKLAVKSVVLSDKVMSLIPGETIKIKGTCIPSNAILTLDWKSSNPSVATVKYLSSGQPYGDGTVVEAQINSIMPGTAVITATSSNGVEATCVITVYPDITAKAQAAVDLLRGALKHPTSLILHSVRAFRGSSTDVIEINYSAMNGFGGYNRGWFHYTGTVNGSVEYSVIDKYNYPFIEIDIRSLK